MSEDVVVQPDQEFRAAMRSLIGERWRELWKALPAAVANEDPEGVHKLRVASRRLRAAMDVSTDCFPAKWFNPLHKRARAITSALGTVRDHDVQLEQFAKLRRRANAAERQGIDLLTSKIERERARAREEMADFLSRIESSNLRKTSKRRFPIDGAADNGASSKTGKKKRSARK